VGGDEEAPRLGLTAAVFNGDQIADAVRRYGINVRAPQVGNRGGNLLLHARGARRFR
jgi:hypothetical protein